MKKRKGLLVEDECYDKYCITKCDKFPNKYIGSLSCLSCIKFISEEENYNSVIVLCKS
jgi:hypothetical protein